MKKVRKLPNMIRPYLMMTHVSVDSELSLEFTFHLAFQRGREEGKVKGESYLEHRSQKNWRRWMDIPSFPAPPRGRPTWRGVRRPSLDMDTANLGSASIPEQFTRHLYLPLTATLALVARRPISDGYTHARRTELRCHGRRTGKSVLLEF
jgi:hypothetical protein